MCPVCIVAVGAGLGLSRWLGIDDAISSIWIGALLMALILWTISEMRKRQWGFRSDTIVVFAVYFLLVFLPLYFYDIIGHPQNIIFGIDKIIFGTFLGVLTFLLSYRLHMYLKTKNNGKSYFPYQKVVLPLAILLIFSSITWIMLMNL